jgi:hypothetical protein
MTAARRVPEGLRRIPICAVPDCKNPTRLSEQHCNQHRHESALQAEIERVGLMVPLKMRELSAQYGPGLENLLAALSKLAFYADPARGQNIGGGSRSAGLPDKWAGTSQLAEFGNHVTLKFAGDTVPYRKKMAFFASRLDDLAEKIERDLDPHEDHKRPRRPRCRRSDCKQKDKSQDVDSKFCKKCGHPISIPEEEEDVA